MIEQTKKPANAYTALIINKHLDAAQEHLELRLREMLHKEQYKHDLCQHVLCDVLLMVREVMPKYKEK